MIDTTKLLEHLNIRDVIELYTGNRIRHNKTLCPFHSEKTASLTVKTDKGLWHCWGCGKGGNAINFTREFYGLSFIDACKKLSADFKVDDIGLWDGTNTSHDIWDQVERECREKRKQELQQVQDDINREIDTLTAVHRCLFHLGYYEAAERYAQELDDLERYKEAWR